jgi:pSer/pThr/pTyr-binding forkhead associated (FHA) protein
VILLDLACSRAHARIESTPEGFALVDAGSANGTWLDGGRIPPHELHLLDDGDQFLVGEILLEFAYLPREAPVAPPASARPILSGDLERLTFPDLVQLLGMAGKSGLLRIEHPDGQGVLSFVEGQVFDVRGGDPEPEEAFFELTRLRSGRFEFLEGPPAVVRRLDRPTTHLLVEAARRLDEAR